MYIAFIHGFRDFLNTLYKTRARTVNTPASYSGSSDSD
jgi:hypothetical protein